MANDVSRLNEAEPTPNPQLVVCDSPTQISSSANVDSVVTPVPQTADGSVGTQAAAGASTVSDGALIGPYRIVRKLGQGGMGAVYEAMQTKLEKTVALKVLPTEVTQSATALSRFEREMKAVGKLDHPNIVRAMDVDEHNGMHYLVMEFVDGIDLTKLIALHGQLPIGTACELIRQAAAGLEHAHAMNLVHRDIKPSNLLLSTTGQLKILDLGLARLHGDANSGEVPSLTSYGQILGTPDYMAPEQWDSSHEIDGRADLYALGCTFFFLLVGRPPYGDSEHKSLSKKMAGHTLELAPDLRRLRADVPEELVAIYRRMMAKQAAKRFANAGELAAALQQFLQKFPACAEDILPTRLMQLVQAEITPAVSDEASNPHAPTIIKNADSDELDFTQKLAIESLVDDFEQQWQSGERRSLADVIPTSGPLRKGLLASLIPVAMELHRQADVRPPFEQWLDTFPELATEHAWFASVPKPWRDEVEDLLNPSTINSLPIPAPDKSDLSVTAVLTSPKTQPNETQAKPTRTNRSRMWIGMSVLGVLLLLGVIIIKIKKPDGTVTEVKVPEGTEVDLSGLPKGSKVEILPDAGAKMPQVTKGNIPDAPKPDAPKVAVGFDPAAERKAAEWVVKFGICTLYDEKDQFLGQPDTGAPALPQGPFYVREVVLSGVDNAGLKALAGCQRLQSVRFLGIANGKVSAAGLQALSECRSLKKLEIGATSVGAGLGDLLKSWPQLEELYLYGAPIDDDVLAGFPDCPKLTVLQLGSATPITDAGLKQLVVHCPNLERLEMAETSGLQRTTLVPLAPLKKLRHLMLMGDQVTEEGIKVLEALPTLDSVWLSSPGLNQAAVRLLAIESKFRSVVLGRYTPTLQLTDADFRQLSKYRGLREIELRGELRVTDAVLLELAEMTDLKKLRLYQVQVPIGGAAPYSAEGIAKFRERRPDVYLSVELTDYPASSSIPFAVLQQLDQTDPLPAWELPAGAPQPVVMPCSAEDAIARQKAWAEFLKRPVIEELDVAEVARLRKEGNKREGEAPAEPRGGNKGDQPKDGSAGASPSQTLKFAVIPPGEIRRMFTRDFQGEYEPGTPVRRLRVNKPFAISTTEVTWDQFRQFVEATGYQTEAELNGVGRPDRDGKPDPQGKITWRNPGWKVDPQEPVTQVTSRDAAAFCDWLTKSARSDRIHAVDGKSTPNGQQADDVKRPDKSGHYELYRLPTEAEWHHACRAGSSHKYVVSPDAKDLAEYAWSKESLDPDPQANPLHRVGTKKSNPFGLHDMQGNVWEHVSESYQLAQTPYLRGHDPIGAPVGGVSGGGWENLYVQLAPTEPLSGNRHASSNIGFRVVRQLDDAPQPGWLDRPLVLNPGQSLSRLALVPRPEPIPGLRSWSVELAGTHLGTSGFTAIAGSPKGDLVAVGNDYGKISLWDREGKYRGALLGHDGRVVSLHFSPDGRWLASCDMVFGYRGNLGNSVRIWDVESRMLHAVVPCGYSGQNEPYQVEFSPDSQRLAFAQYSGASFVILDLKTGRVQESSQRGLLHNSGFTWSPDGTKLASVSDRLRLWDSRTLKLLQEGDLTPHRPAGHKVGWSPDGKWLATTHEGGKLAIRDVTTLKVERTFGSNVADFQWLPDNQRVAISQDGPGVEIFNAMTGELATKIPVHTATLTLLDNGREVAIPAPHAPGLHVYDTTTGKLLHESPRVGAVWGNNVPHAVSPKGDELMSFLSYRTMRVTDTATGREKRTIPLAVHIGVPALSPNGALFAGLNENWSTGLILDATSGAFVADLPHGNATFASWTWSPDSQRLATGTTDKKVRLWNIAETKVEYELVEHTGTVVNVAWSPDGARLASAAEDQTVRLWDTRTGKLIASYDKFPEATQFHRSVHGYTERCLAWSRDGRQLWIALTNHIVPLDPETGAFGPMENASNGNGVTFLNPSPDGQRLLVRADEDWTFVRDHQAPTPRLLGQHLGLTAEWHPDSRRFLGWDVAYGSVGFDVETNRRLGTHFPWLVDNHWLTIGPTGHYVGSPGIEAHIVYVAQHDDGSQRTYTPTEFAEKFGWKNDPDKAELLGK